MLEERRSGGTGSDIEPPPGPCVFDDRMLVQNGDSRYQPAPYKADIAILCHRGFDCPDIPARGPAGGLRRYSFERNNARRQARGAKSFEKSQGRYPAYWSRADSPPTLRLLPATFSSLASVARQSAYNRCPLMSAWYGGPCSSPVCLAVGSKAPRRSRPLQRNRRQNRWRGGSAYAYTRHGGQLSCQG